MDTKALMDLLAPQVPVFCKKLGLNQSQFVTKLMAAMQTEAQLDNGIYPALDPCVDLVDFIGPKLLLQDDTKLGGILNWSAVCKHVTSGGVLFLCPQHLSLFEPLLLRHLFKDGLGAPREFFEDILYVAGHIVEDPIARIVSGAFNRIPVVSKSYEKVVEDSQRINRNALQTFSRLSKDNHPRVMVLYLEGTQSATLAEGDPSNVLPIKAFIKAGRSVMVLPMYSRHAEKVMGNLKGEGRFENALSKIEPASVEFRFGTPIMGADLPTKNDATLNVILEGIAKLMPLELRG